MIVDGAYRLAVLGSAGSATLAAAGATLASWASVLSSLAAIAAALVTVGGLAFRRQRRRRNQLPMPIPPASLPTTRVTREDYARQLMEWERYSHQLEQRLQDDQDGVS